MNRSTIITVYVKTKLLGKSLIFITLYLDTPFIFLKREFFLIYKHFYHYLNSIDIRNIKK